MLGTTSLVVLAPGEEGMHSRRLDSHNTGPHAKHKNARVSDHPCAVTLAVTDPNGAPVRPKSQGAMGTNHDA